MMKAILTLNSAGLSVIRDERGLDTDKLFAEAIGISAGTVSRVLSRKAKPGNEFVAAVLSAFPTKFEDIFDVVHEEQTNAA